MRNSLRKRINKFFVKSCAIVLSLAMLVGVFFGFAGCAGGSTDKTQQDDSGITVTPPDGEDPGVDKPGTEEPGTEEPGTEEPGTEEPGTEEPGEEPGTEEPETPKTIDELFAEGNEEYVDIVSDTLNDNLYEKIINKTISKNVENIKDARWEIVSQDGVNIDKIRIFAFEDYSDTVMTYNITNVVPKITITIADLIIPDATKLEKAFDTTVRGGAKYSREYSFSFNPSIQEARKELKEAVNKKLASDGIIQPVTQDTQSFIVDDGTNVDTILTGTARRIVVININYNRVEEYTIRIKENQGNNNDTTLIENLNQNKYYNVEYDHEVLNYSQNIFEKKDITDLATVIISPVVYVDPKDETTGETEF